MTTLWHFLSTVALVVGFATLFVLFCFVLLLLVFALAEKCDDDRQLHRFEARLD